MHRVIAARLVSPLLVSCAPVLGAAMLLQTSLDARAADADTAAIQAPLERLSDAPWKLAHHANVLRQRAVQLELQPDTLTPRPALDFQNAPRSARMPVGTLRMALSDHSSLSLRPRSRGLHLTYREQF